MKIAGSDHHTDAVPTVSVVMPVYNCVQYLQESVDSVLSQTLVNLELIIVDDGSTDGSWELLERFTDPRIRLLRQERGGAYAARNTGIAAARAAFIASMDADDICHPERLRMQYEHLSSHPRAGMVGSWFVRFDSGSEQEFHGPTVDRRIKYALYRENVFPGGGVMIRTSVLAQIGAYRKFYADDYDLWLRISEAFEVANLPNVLYRYRLSDSQITRRMGSGMAEDGKRAVQLAFQRCLGLTDDLGYSCPQGATRAAWFDTCQAFALHALRRGDVGLGVRLVASSLRRDQRRTLLTWARGAVLVSACVRSRDYWRPRVMADRRQADGGAQ